MSAGLFLFVQFEFPWELGPAEGRYLLRGGREREPEQVVVLGERRATVIDPVSVAGETQAQAWLRGLDSERETLRALGALNRMLFAHRIATADPHVHGLSPRQALVIRAGWGEGEQLAYGRWQHERKLPWREPKARKRAAALRPQERLARLLGAQETPLACEEHTLRARLDLDEGRLRHAAIELEVAYLYAIAELKHGRPDLEERIAELESLREGVLRASHEARLDSPEEPDHETVSHALGRLEAALRARTAAGWERRP